MVLVRSDSGQLMLVSQQALAQAQRVITNPGLIQVCVCMLTCMLNAVPTHLIIDWSHCSTGCSQLGQKKFRKYLTKVSQEVNVND